MKKSLIFLNILLPPLFFVIIGYLSTFTYVYDKKSSNSLREINRILIFDKYAEMYGRLAFGRFNFFNIYSSNEKFNIKSIKRFYQSKGWAFCPIHQNDESHLCKDGAEMYFEDYIHIGIKK